MVRLRNAEGKLSTTAKVIAVALSIISGGVVVGDNLRSVAENRQDISELKVDVKKNTESIQGVRLIQAEQRVRDSVMLDYLKEIKREVKRR